MRKISPFVLSAVIALAVAGRGAAPVHAFKPFKKEFENLYIKENPATDAEKSLKQAAAAADCGICHGPKGTEKKVRNTYGKAIEDHLPPGLDEDGLAKLKKDGPEIKKLLEKAAEEHSIAGDPKSPTFGELIKQGKLPGKDVAKK